MLRVGCNAQTCAINPALCAFSCAYWRHVLFPLLSLQPYIEHFADCKDKLVYLTADSENELQEVRLQLLQALSTRDSMPDELELFA